MLGDSFQPFVLERRTDNEINMVLGLRSVIFIANKKTRLLAKGVHNNGFLIKVGWS